MDRGESTRLLHRARAGEPAALDALYTRVAGRLLALIRLRMGSTLRAQLESRDVLQTTLLKAFERLEQFEGESGTTLMAWLARIAENEIRDLADHHHRQRRDARRVVPLEAAGPLASRVRSAFSQVALDEEAARLERAIESLDEPQREVVMLRKFEELSFKEIAARMGRSEDACRMLLARAMAALTLALHRPS